MIFPLKLRHRPNAGESVFVTGTFDEWKKTVQLDKVGDNFEKTVTLPETTEKIYYKVSSDLFISSALSPPIRQHPFGMSKHSSFDASRPLPPSSVCIYSILHQIVPVAPASAFIPAILQSFSELSTSHRTKARSFPSAYLVPPCFEAAPRLCCH